LQRAGVDEPAGCRRRPGRRRVARGAKFFGYNQEFDLERTEKESIMGFLIGLLVVIMLLDCLALILLVLIQLPKKEAGAGLAFGAGATDALFGAGSGTVL